MSAIEKDEEDVGLESGLAWAESVQDGKPDTSKPALAAGDGEASNSADAEASDGDTSDPLQGEPEENLKDPSDSSDVTVVEEETAVSDSTQPETETETIPVDLLETRDIDDEDKTPEVDNSQSDTVAVKSLSDTSTEEAVLERPDPKDAPHTSVRIIKSPRVYSGEVEAAHGKRAPESDEIVAVVLNVIEELPAVIGEQPPNPWTVIASTPLLRRCFVSCRLAGLLDLKICADPSIREKIQVDASKAGVKLTFFDSFEELSLPATGRILFIDPCALHDSNSLLKIQNWRGHKVALAVTGEGDGYRAQVEGITVRELGPDVLPFESFSAGAASVPIEYLEIVDRLGFNRALESFVMQGYMGASHFLRSQSREIKSIEDLDEIEELIIKNLCLNTDGFLDRHLNRPISLGITRLLFETTWIKADLVTVLSFLFGILAGPLVSQSGSNVWAPIFATLTLWISLILDRVDGEIARLRLEQSSHGRILDRFSKLIVNGGVLLGLCHWFDYHIFVGIGAGLAGFGLAIAAFISLSQPQRLDASHPSSPGDHIDGLIHNRNYYYLLSPLLLGLAVLHQSSPETTPIVAGGSLIVLGTLVTVLALTLGFIGTQRGHED